MLRRKGLRHIEFLRSECSGAIFVLCYGIIFIGGSNLLLAMNLMAYARGLSTILASGNITTYPPLCAKVTASFSVLSDTINAVKSTLEKVHGRKDITNVISQLQKSEGEKLNLTAALHLERLRLRNVQLEGGEGGDGNGSDDRTEMLLKDGIQSLEQKISGVVEAINEVLEELRCVAADENE